MLLENLIMLLKMKKKKNIAKEFLAFFSLVGSILSLFSEKPKKFSLN